MVKYLRSNGNEEPINEAEMKAIFYGSMPKAWRDEYESNSTNNVHTAVLESILVFMQRKEAKAMAKKKSQEQQQQAKPANNRNKRNKKQQRDASETEDSDPG